MNFNELLKKISPTTFNEIMSIAPRKVRESLFSHYGIKNKKRGLVPSLKDKKESRVKDLHVILQNASQAREQEFLKELFRNWLFHQRPLLKSTLDFLKVENDNGLIEVEPDFFKDLKDSQIKELLAHLKANNFPDEAVLVYLSFMEVPHIEKHF